MYFNLLFCREASGSAIHPDKQINVDAVIHEKYIDLMCEYEPKLVYNYVIAAEGYRLEPTLEVCKEVTKEYHYL